MTLLDGFAEQQTRLGRLLNDPTRMRVWRWLAPLLITVLAAVLRLWNLGHPDRLAFDETYYVKDAWSLWTLGYEGTWEKDSNPAFAEGNMDILDPKGSYVAHPPLGKWVIALGMAPFGQTSSFGWRLSTAILGTATVLLVYFVAREVSRSFTVSVLASGLIAIDGLGIVMSRTALLDTTLGFFILLGVYFVLLDRRRGIRLGHSPVPDATPPPAEGSLPRGPLWGRILWRRPWLIAAGIALGAASAVKWSGLYALAGLGIYLVVVDALARRRTGVYFWPTDAVVRQGPVTFLLLVPPALAAYLASWSGWFATTGGWGRLAGNNALEALWKYHSRVYNFHVGLTSDHTYESPAWQWPLLIRPTAIWVGDKAETCWWSDNCIAVSSTVPNPLIWYASVAASLWLLYLFVRGLVRRRPAPVGVTFPLVGIAITWVPWLLYPDRTIFQFYSIVILPYLVIALAVVLRQIAGRPSDSLYRRQAGERTVLVFLGVVVLLSAFYYPVWTGMDVPHLFWRLHNWMPTWI